jgi:hypothetical protein
MLLLILNTFKNNIFINSNMNILQNWWRYYHYHPEGNYVKNVLVNQFLERLLY